MLGTQKANEDKLRTFRARGRMSISIHVAAYVTIKAMILI